MPDPHHLQRFVDAQASTYPHVLAELRAARKSSHWIWFIFPQLRGLGSSPTAQRYAIASRAEAEAYLAHPILGPRLRECAQLVLAAAPRPAAAILGEIDALKLRSSMTLFHEISGDPLFQQLLDAFYQGHPDPRTLQLLS